MENTALVIDARSRDLAVFTASATTTETRRLILRKGVDVGKVGDLKGVMDFPIIVLGSYQAMSSAGFVSIEGGERFKSRILVGGCGFPGKSGKGEGLRVFPRPVRAIVLPAGSCVSKVDTHSRNSNSSTADAALAGIKMIVKNTGSLFIVEGQSDRITATRFITPAGEETPEFPPEHRTDLFFEERLVIKVIMSAARWLLTPEDGEHTDPADDDVKGEATKLLREYVNGGDRRYCVRQSLDLLLPSEETIEKVFDHFSEVIDS